MSSSSETSTAQYRLQSGEVWKTCVKRAWRKANVNILHESGNLKCFNWLSQFNKCQNKTVNCQCMKPLLAYPAYVCLHCGILLCIQRSPHYCEEDKQSESDQIRTISSSTDFCFSCLTLVWPWNKFTVTESKING